MNVSTGEVQFFESEEAIKNAGPQWKPISEDYLSENVRAQLKQQGRAQISRNSPCPCGSNKRFKRCCMNQF